MSLAPKDVETVVKNVVAATTAYDPWTSCEYDYAGDRIDRLLTHASLIQQLVHVCGPVPGDLPLPQVADKVWEELFVNRSPSSEHCRVVLSTLNRTNLRHLLQRRDLPALRGAVAQMSTAQWWAALLGAAQLAGIGVEHGREFPSTVPHRRWVQLTEDVDMNSILNVDYVVMEVGGGPVPERALKQCAESNHMVLC